MKRRQMADGGYRWRMGDPLRDGWKVCMVMCVCLPTLVIWQDHTYTIVRPYRTLTGMWQCHMSCRYVCVCESPILLCPDPFPDSGGKCRRAENIIVAAMYKPQILISLCGLFSFKRKNHSGLEKIIFSSPASVATNTDIKRPACC